MASMDAPPWGLSKKRHPRMDASSHPLNTPLSPATPCPPQVVELDFQYPSEGIHKRWDGGYRITALASTPDQVRACSGGAAHTHAHGLQRGQQTRPARGPATAAAAC